MERHTNISCDFAAELIIQYGEMIQQPELVEILEKRVANGIDDLIQVNGVASLIPIYDGFSINIHSRPKILQFMSDTIVNEFDDLETSE
jgi:hypothetical protein